mgnify:CR=1 FL=1
MVLAKDLHEKIQKMQIQIEGSKRLAFIEKELIETNKCISALIDKLEGKQPDDINEEQEQEEVEDDDTEQDIKEEEDDDPEPDYDDDDEEEQETEEQIDARQECDLAQIHLADQQPKHIEQFIGYNEDKEKLIKANNTKKYDDYAYTWYEDIDRDLKTKLIKRVIVLANVNYSLQEKIYYLEVKARDYEKYKSLSGILEQLLITHKSLLDKKYPTQRKLYNYSVGNTLYQFKVRRTEFIYNIVQHFLKLSKLKEKRFN